MVYAFDFDGTLDNDKVLNYAIDLRRKGHQLWVVTARADNNFNYKKMKPFLDQVGLSKFSVLFCGNKSKIDSLIQIGADVYIDNISNEFGSIKAFTKTKPVLWQELF